MIKFVHRQLKIAIINILNDLKEILNIMRRETKYKKN